MTEEKTGSLTRYMNTARYLTLARVGSLCDGIFTISMTLLVLQIKIPSRAEIQSQGDLINYLIAQYPTLISYLVSFIMLGSYWFGHHLQFNYLTHQINVTLFWLNILFFLLVAIIPFTAGLLGEYHQYPAVQILYAANLLCLSLTLRFHLVYAYRQGFTKEELDPAIYKIFMRRLWMIPGLCAITMVCALISTNVSFFLFVALPIFFVLFNRNNTIEISAYCEKPQVS